MIISEFKYKKFTLPLKKPFKTSKGELLNKTGFLIQLTDSTGTTGFGEVSVLDEFGGESLEFAESELQKINPGGEKIENLFYQKDKFNSNSIKFAIDQAIIQILIKKGFDLKSEFNFNLSGDIKINGVIGENRIEDILNEVDLLVSAGYDTLKIKVGTLPFEEEFLILKEIHFNYGDIKLRLDVNGKWTYDEAVVNTKRLDNLNIQYIEQPVTETSALIKLAGCSGIPVCADESVRSYKDACEIISSGKIKYISLKPSLLGSILDFFRIKKFAEMNKINLILTSAFESAVGNSMLLMLASSIEHNHPHGLGTQNLFADNLIENPFPVANASCCFSPERLGEIEPGVLN